MYSLLIFCGCTVDLSKKNDTNLEFWIAEDVSDVDFSTYEERFGLMGGREYYGSDYTPTIDENGERRDPEHCVIYTITSYPDYAFGKSHVTRITITDPSVTVYGLTIDSTLQEIDDTLSDCGFRRAYNSNDYKKGKTTIRFSDDTIVISVKVSNLMGIQF